MEALKFKKPTQLLICNILKAERSIKHETGMEQKAYSYTLESMPYEEAEFCEDSTLHTIRVPYHYPFSNFLIL